MSAYVDELRDHDPSTVAPSMRRFGLRWCSLTADTLPELHYVADQIGLSRASFQAAPFPHYNLVPSKRRQALSCGARYRPSGMQQLERRRP